MSHPDTSVLDGLTSVNLSHAVDQAIAAGTMAKTPDGTGPFEYSSWCPNTSFTVTANPNYWGGKVSLGTVKIETIPSEQSIAAAVEAGTVQIGLLTEPQVASTCPSLTVSKRCSTSRTGRSCSRTRPGRSPTSNDRLAIACAINRKQVLEDAVFGAGKVVGPVPLGPYASNPVSAVCPTQNIGHGQEVPHRRRATRAASRSRRSPRPTSTRRAPPRRPSCSPSWPRPGSR